MQDKALRSCISLFLQQCICFLLLLSALPYGWENKKFLPQSAGKHISEDLILKPQAPTRSSGPPDLRMLRVAYFTLCLLENLMTALKKCKKNFKMVRLTETRMKILMAMRKIRIKNFLKCLTGLQNVERQNSCRNNRSMLLVKSNMILVNKESYKMLFSTASVAICSPSLTNSKTYLVLSKMYKAAHPKYTHGKKMPPCCMEHISP